MMIIIRKSLNYTKCDYHKQYSLNVYLFHEKFPKKNCNLLNDYTPHICLSSINTGTICTHTENDNVNMSHTETCCSKIMQIIPHYYGCNRSLVVTALFTIVILFVCVFRQ